MEILERLQLSSLVSVQAISSFENEDFECLWMREMVSTELSYALAGGFHFDRAVIEKGGDNAVYLDVDVLELFEAEASNSSMVFPKSASVI